jgi:hypothetical protein
MTWMMTSRVHLQIKESRVSQVVQLKLLVRFALFTQCEGNDRIAKTIAASKNS